MVLVAGLVELHGPGLQTVGASHGRNHDGLLLGHFLSLLLRQQGDTAVIVLPVLNNGKDPSVLKLAEFPHIVAVDIAVQPVEQMFFFLLCQIITV